MKAPARRETSAPRWRDRLPRGQTLPREIWARRHRALTLIAWAHVPALFLFGLVTHHSVASSFVTVIPIAAFSALAGAGSLKRRERAAMVCFALLTSSAMLVHLWHGRVEGHFHFFVMVALLATYEEWFPYLLAFVYVLVHHGLMGAIDAGSVYDHSGAEAHPWQWAGIHAFFISALGLVNIVSWRMNEDARDATRESDLRFRSAFEDAPIGMALVGLDGIIQRVNARLCAATGRPEDELVGLALDDLTPDEDRDGSAWPPPAGGEAERRFARGDGSVGWGLWQHSLVQDREGQPAYWVSHVLDISARKGAERQLDYQAHYDSLTSLPNRTLFLKELRAQIAASGGGEIAVLFVDLDNFKVINDSLGHSADAAMYRAKELGKARCEVFDDSMRERAVERLDLEGGLRHALERGELRVLYQPQVELATGRIIGAEALLRWEHPDRGTVVPPLFIPIAEQTGLIVPIGAWVLEEACRQAAVWAASSGRELTMSVNVSSRQLADEDFEHVVERALHATGLEPRLLCLEITESAVMADPDAATALLERLKRLGVRLAIDDFGVGYSSLSQLKTLLPVDTIKIDKSFVDGVPGEGEDQAIVDAVLRLADGLGLAAVAEGVETSEQVEALLGMGCRLSQGFHFARPQPAADVERLLEVDALGELAA